MTNIDIQQSTSIPESVTSAIIDKLYTRAKLSKVENANNSLTMNLTGNLTTTHAHLNAVTYLTTKFPNLLINLTGDYYIDFADPEVERVLTSQAGLVGVPNDGVGITTSNLNLTINIPAELFKDNTSITSFNELGRFYLVSKINSKAFYECSNLTNIDLSSVNGTLVHDVFYNCTNLQSIGNTDGILIIEDRAFCGCTNLLIELSFPSLTMAGQSCFRDSGITKLLNLGTISYTRGQMCQNCTNLTHVVLPLECVTVSGSSFMDCINLTSINLDHVISIEAQAFLRCSSLTSVNIQSAQTIQNSAFLECSGLAININTPNLTSLGNLAFKQSGITGITNLGSITKINEGCFRDCNSLSSVTLPSTVTLIEAGAFRSCNALTSLNTSNITDIGSYAFCYCTNLLTVNLSGLTNRIGQYAFAGCNALTSLGTDTILCTYIDNHAFYKCANLIGESNSGELNFPNLTGVGTGNWGGIFSGCTKLKKVTLGHIIETPSGAYSTPSEPRGLFAGCTELKIADLGDSIEIIYQHNFSWCSSLKAVIIRNPNPPTLESTSFGKMFYNTSQVKIYVPDGYVSTYEQATGFSSFPAGTILSLNDYNEQAILAS